jgi:hypothetical protein
VGDAESSRIKTDNPRQDDELFISPAARQELRIRIRRPVVLGEGSIDDDENKGSESKIEEVVCPWPHW